MTEEQKPPNSRETVETTWLLLAGKSPEELEALAAADGRDPARERVDRAVRWLALALLLAMALRIALGALWE